MEKVMEKNMKKIDGVWHVCRDGWVFVEATEAEVIAHLFNGLSVEDFKACFKSKISKPVLTNL